ncbi:MAG: hypothetical protein F4Z08_04710 [Chloroflexi bacterium]|nr:hypothetical protein [Chloroflexota bacterium]
MTEAAFVLGSVLALVVAFLEGWTTGQVGGEWKRDSIDRQDRIFEVARGAKYWSMTLHALAAGAIFLVAGAAGGASIVNLLLQADVVGSEEVARFTQYERLVAGVGILGTALAAGVAAWRTKVVLEQGPLPARWG